MSGGAGRDRHRVLRQLRAELSRHPAVRSVTGGPQTTYRALRARVAPAWFGRPAEVASLRMTWTADPSPGPAASDRPSDVWRRTPVEAYYALHYSEPAGLDCGIHCEPNPHVDGLLHYQERASPDDPYTYTPLTLAARSAAGLLWEMMDVLADRLDEAG